MPKHVTEWLNAYVDGELQGRQLHKVQEHIAGCQVCRAELESLQGLSSLLREVPAPEFPSAERFTAQVNLRLPRRLPKATKRKVWEVGWWMIPVSLLIVWVFIGTTALVRDAISTASGFGLLKGAPVWLVDGASAGAFWSDRLGEFGLLNGIGLRWAEETESLTRNIILQISIAFLYLSWIATWWERSTRRGRGRPLEG